MLFWGGLTLFGVALVILALMSKLATHDKAKEIATEKNQTKKKPTTGQGKGKRRSK